MGVVTEVGSFTRGSTGNCTVILNTTGGTPIGIIFWIESAGSSDSVNRGNIGFLGSTGQGGLSWFGDTTGDKGSQQNNSKTLSHNKRNGTIQEFIAATGSGANFDLEEFTLNFTAADNGYSIGFMALLEV